MTWLDALEAVFFVGRKVFPFLTKGARTVEHTERVTFLLACAEVSFNIVEDDRRKGVIPRDTETAHAMFMVHIGQLCYQAGQSAPDAGETDYLINKFLTGRAKAHKAARLVSG